MENIISISHLCKSYKGIKAVDDISFTIHKGKLFAFLGLNGAGKSTTINIICGILPKDNGVVTIEGKNIDSDQLLTKQKIGVVFQGSVLDKLLSVYENLRLKAGLYGMSKSEFATSLHTLEDALDLKPLLKRPLGKLSGGQQRRVDLARALIHHPSILILDEPTTGLDPQTRIMVWNCLNKMRQRDGLTILLTTHYMEEAADADYVVILDKGHIVAEDTPNGLKNRYASNCIKLYSRSKESDEMIVKEKLACSHNDEYDRIEIKDISEARRLIVTYPLIFADFELIKGNMDDVFLNVTGKELKEANVNA